MPRKREPSTVEMSLPGLKQWNGYLDEERHRRLQGQAAARAYEEMSSNDAMVGASLYAIESFLRSLEWRVKPRDDSEAALKECEFLCSVRDDMEVPWSEFVSDALSMLVYGYSIHEVVYKIRRGPDAESDRFKSRYTDGRYGWRNLSLRAQESIVRWDIDENTGKIKGAFQQPPPKYDEVYLPMDRCLLFRTKSYKNNPEGISVLRRAYRSWYFKKRLEEVEAVGINRDLTGIPKISVPVEIMSPNATTAQRQVRSEMQRTASLVANDQFSGIVFPNELDSAGKPTGYKFELVSSSGAKQIPADPVIRRYDSRIAMTLAAEFLLLGTEKTGSFALAAEKSTHFARSLEWYARVIQDQLNTVAVPRLMQANGVPENLWPHFEHGPIDTPDLQALGLFLQAVAGGGLITPTPQLEGWIRKSAQAPEPTDEEMEAIEERLESLAKENAQKGEPPPAPVAPGGGDGPAPKPGAPKPPTKKPAPKPKEEE